MKTKLQRKISKVFLYISLLLVVAPLHGQIAKKDSLQISLITCAAGQEVYELFGHTGIRVKECSGAYDVVFNYGLFSFSAPNFIYRFTKGDTDYELGVQDFPSFMFQYGVRGTAVREQVINMNQAEAHDLLDALIVNNRPENKVYRYNFLYDNCTLRAREMINNFVGGRVLYTAPTDSVTTFRDMIHECTKNSPWLSFGIDLALGSPLDRPVSYAEQMFLPAVLMQAYESAHIIKGDTLSIPMTQGEQLILPAGDVFVSHTSPFITPLACTSYLLLFVILLTLYDLRRKKVARIFDSVYFLVGGLVGVLLFFLMFISTHPATFPNYTAFWLQPFHLFIFIAVWVKKVKNIVYYYHFANFALLLLVLLTWHWLPQQFDMAFLPLAMIFLIRSAVYVAIEQKKRKNR